MAAICARLPGTLLKSPLFRGGIAYQNISRQSRKQLQQRLTWSQLKHLHSRSALTVPTHFQQSSRFSWQWLVLMATAGFSHGFLGFNFGKKDEEKKGGDPLLRVYSEAKEAHTQQDFKKAELRYHDALRVADEMLKLKKISFKTYTFAKTNIYDSLADMALMRGELEKAEGLYKETMKGCLQQGLAEDDNAIIELSIKVASIYAMLDRKSEAEQGLLFCIRAQDAKMMSDKSEEAHVKVSDTVREVSAKAGTTKMTSKLTEVEADSDVDADSLLDEEEKARDTEALLGMALETYGRFLMGQRRLPEALPVLERALGVAEKVLGNENVQYIILLNDLATTHILLKHFDLAADLLNKAIATATKVKSSQLPMLYCNLGAVFLRTSKLDDAEAACLKGQELSNKGQNPMAFSMSQKCLKKISQVRKKA